MKILIGLVGKKQSGKDSLASFLHLLRPSSLAYRRLSFADGVKQELAEAFDCSVEQLEKRKKQLRPILQLWGTEYRRKQDENYWVNKLKPQYLSVPDNSLIVVTDVRFKNEAEFIKSFSGLLVRVERPALVENVDTHSSETEQDSILCQYTVRNHQTLKYLEFEAKILLDFIKHQYRI